MSFVSEAHMRARITYSYPWSAGLTSIYPPGGDP